MNISQIILKHLPEKYDNNLQCRDCGFSINEDCNHLASYNRCLDDLISKLPEIEKEILREIEKLKGTLDNCNKVSGRVQSACFKRNNEVSKHSKIIDQVIHWLTNKDN